MTINVDVTETFINRVIEDALEVAFDRIESNRGQIKPTAIMHILERNWGVGDMWAEWWTSFDSEGWE